MNLFSGHTIQKVIAVLIVSLFFTGCISDDMSDCFPKLSLRFVYDYNKDYVDKFDQQVNTLDLFIYDKETNELLDSFHIKKEELLQGNIYEIKLLPKAEQYLAVIWGNLNHEYYDCDGFSVYSGMKLELRSNAAGLVAQRQGSLFHGIIEFRAGDSGEIRVPLIKDTNDIHLIITDTSDEGAYAGPGQLTAIIDADNSAYKYDNSPIANYKQIQHIANTSPDAADNAVLKADLTVMRLFIGDNAKITIQESHFGIPITDERGKEIKNTSLTDLLMKDENINSNAALDRYDDYTLYFETKVIRGTTVLALVRINSWNLVVMDGGTGGL